MKYLTIFFSTLLLFVSCTTKTPEPIKDEATLKQDAKMQWWREARFGLFIHWGLYAIPAGEWKGKEVPGISEWIMYRSKIPVAEYEKFLKQFNPQKFNADEWVTMAKNAGMKYIVITSKHHDGFAMFNSQASKYNITQATSFSRDPLKELAEACKKQGIRLGFYYSQAQDWHEPGGSYAGIDRGMEYWDPAVKRDSLMNYIDSKSVPQVKEILENYGGLDILWWDTPDGMTEEAATKLKAVSDKYPNLITNDRLFRGWKGDFTTPEQYVPPTGLSYDWEVCMTMNTSWGYKKMDNNWKSSQDLIRMLVDIASKGGNLLLNVGPTEEGLFPQASIDRLKEIGTWMAKNSESIYGTSASQFFKLPWGRSTSKKDENSNTLYLHVFNWPQDGVITVPGFKAKISEVYQLADLERKFKYKFRNGNLIIDAASATVDPVNTVIVVKTGKILKVTSNKPSLKNDKITLNADFADIYNAGYGTQAKLVGSGENSVIQNWVDPRARLEWVFNTTDTGKFNVVAKVKVIQPCKLSIRVDGQNKEVEVAATGNEFQTINLSEVRIKKAGDQTISLRPVRDNWGNIELMSLEFMKQK